MLSPRNTSVGGRSADTKVVVLSPIACGPSSGDGAAEYAVIGRTPMAMAAVRIAAIICFASFCFMLFSSLGYVFCGFWFVVCLCLRGPRWRVKAKAKSQCLRLKCSKQTQSFIPLFEAWPHEKGSITLIHITTFYQIHTFSYIISN